MYTPMEVKKKKGTVTVKHAYQSKNGDDREVAGSTKNEEILGTYAGVEQCCREKSAHDNAS